MGLLCHQLIINWLIITSCQFSCLQNGGNKLYCFGLTVNIYQRLKGKKLSPKCTCWLLVLFFWLEPLIFLLASKSLSRSKFWLASSSIAAWFLFLLMSELWLKSDILYDVSFDWNLIFYSVWCQSFDQNLIFYSVWCRSFKKKSDVYSVWCQSFAWNQAYTLSCSFMNSHKVCVMMSVYPAKRPVSKSTKDIYFPVSVVIWHSICFCL